MTSQLTDELDVLKKHILTLENRVTVLEEIVSTIDIDEDTQNRIIRLRYGNKRYNS